MVLEEDKLYLVNIPIIRKDYDVTNSAKYKGNLEIISNWKGIIYDWKITFDEVYIDLYATPSHFTLKPSIFKHRERLFKKLGLIQESRPSAKQNKIFKLNYNQINLLNEYFNDREQYNSTIKSVIGILKGNNPGGEYSNPSSAELIINEKMDNSNIKNFIIIIDDLCRNKVECFNNYEDLAENLSLEDYSKLDNRIYRMFKHLQKNKFVNNETFNKYKLEIENYVNEYNLKFVNIEKLAFQKRQEYAKKISEEYKNKILPFGFDGNDNTLYQKCHIYEYSSIRDKAVEIYIQNNDIKSTEKILDMISDPDNFIPLPESYHRVFDKKKFSYDQNGILFWFDNRFSSKLPEIYKYQKIEDEFMTNKRKKYFNMRNELIFKKAF